MSDKPEIHWVDPSGSLPAQQLVEAVYESLIEECVNEEDPYKIYLARMRSQIYQNSDQVSHKISDGYKSILQNIKH